MDVYPLFGYLCTTSMQNCCAVANSVFFSVAKHHFPGSCHSASVLHTQVPKKCTDLDLSLSYILTSETQSKFARNNQFPSARCVLPVDIFQALAACLLHQDHV